MVFRLVRAVPKALLVILFIASIGLNVASLTLTGVYTVLSGAISAVGMSTVMAREASAKITRQHAVRKAAKSTTRRVSKRAVHSAARNSSTAIAEAIPVFGVAVIGGALALEIKDACDTARDMTGLEAAVANPDDPEGAQARAMEGFDCKELIPEADELPSREEIWGKMKEAPGEAWQMAGVYLDDLPEVSLPEFSVPDVDVSDSLAKLRDTTKDTMNDLWTWWNEDQEEN